MHFRISMAGVLLGFLITACASLPNQNKSASVKTDTILFTLAKGEVLYTEDEMVAIMLEGGSRHAAKYQRRAREAQQYPFGSKRNPVRVHMPEGQRAYLNRLRCSDDKSQPTYERVGNFGAGPYETIIDGYSLTCPGKDPVMIYLDMYFPDHIENRAPSGFRILSTAIAS